MGAVSSRISAAGAAVLLPAAFTPIGWWLVGDQTEAVVRHERDLMYMLTPPRWSPAVDRLALLASAAVTALLALVLVRVVRRCRPLWVALLLLGGTLVVGLAWGWFGRILTIGAHGANMSALAIPLAPVLVMLQAGLATAAGLLAWPLEPAPHPAPGRSGQVVVR